MNIINHTLAILSFEDRNPKATDISCSGADDVSFVIEYKIDGVFKTAFISMLFFDKFKGF